MTCKFNSFVVCRILYCASQSEGVTELPAHTNKHELSHTHTHTHTHTHECERKLSTSSEEKEYIYELIPNNSVPKPTRLTVYSTTDKGEPSTRQKDKKEAEYGNMNAILAELRSHRLSLRCFNHRGPHRIRRCQGLKRLIADKPRISIGLWVLFLATPWIFLGHHLLPRNICGSFVFLSANNVPCLVLNQLPAAPRHNLISSRRLSQSSKKLLLQHQNWSKTLKH